MKKISIIFAISLIFLLTGCSANPDSKVTEYLDLVKSNYQNISSEEFFIGSSELNNTSFEIESDSENNELNVAFTKILTEFDYEIVGNEVNGNEATVEVKFTTYPINEIMTDWFISVMEFTFANAFSGEISDEEMNQKTLELFNNVIDGVEKNKVTTATAYLEYVDNGWLFKSAEQNKEFINALTGGLVFFTESINESE